jgi:hypothetical protein
VVEGDDVKFKGGGEVFLALNFLGVFESVLRCPNQVCRPDQPTKDVVDFEL